MPARRPFKPAARLCFYNDMAGVFSKMGMKHDEKSQLLKGKQRQIYPDKFPASIASDNKATSLSKTHYYKIFNRLACVVA
jgi:hypothetical protein